MVQTLRKRLDIPRVLSYIFSNLGAFMDLYGQHAKMVAVDADLFESVGYEDINHCLYIKFRNSPTVRFEKVPRFRFQGLLGAPRKDAYFKTFIQNQFLSKPVQG